VSLDSGNSDKLLSRQNFIHLFLTTGMVPEAKHIVFPGVKDTTDRYGKYIQKNALRGGNRAMFVPI
jgi:hypothetical protein